MAYCVFVLRTAYHTSSRHGVRCPLARGVALTGSPPGLPIGSRHGLRAPRDGVESGRPCGTRAGCMSASASPWGWRLRARRGDSKRLSSGETGWKRREPRQGSGIAYRAFRTDDNIDCMTPYVGKGGRASWGSDREWVCREWTSVWPRGCRKRHRKSGALFWQRIHTEWRAQASFAK